MTFTALDKWLTNALAIQHFTFPFQAWMGDSIEFLEDGTSLIVALTAWLSIMIVYSVAASTTINQSLQKTLIFKLCIITIVFGIATTVHRKTWAVSGLMIEAMVSGLFESWTFDCYLSTQFAPRPRGARWAKLLAFIIANLLLIPRALSILGVPTHHSLRMKPDFMRHVTAIMMTGLVNEGLILARPSTFARFSMVKMQNGRNVLSKQPGMSPDIGLPATSRTLYKITAIHQIGLWVVICLAGNSVNAISAAIIRPLSAARWQVARFLRVRHSVRGMQLEVSQGLRLLLLGKRKDFLKLLPEIWAQADILTVLRKLTDILLDTTILGLCVAALYIILQLLWLLLAKVVESFDP